MLLLTLVGAVIRGRAGVDHDLGSGFWRQRAVPDADRHLIDDGHVVMLVVDVVPGGRCRFRGDRFPDLRLQSGGHRATRFSSGAVLRVTLVLLVIAGGVGGDGRRRLSPGRRELAPDRVQHASHPVRLIVR